MALEIFAVWSDLSPIREVDLATVLGVADLSVREIVLEFPADAELVVRCNGDVAQIEEPMDVAAKCYNVGDFVLSRLGEGDDMTRLEDGNGVFAGHRALISVRVEYELPKGPLAEPSRGKRKVDAKLVPDGTYGARIERIRDGAHATMLMENGMEVDATAARDTVTFTPALANAKVKVSFVEGQVVALTRV